MPRDLQEPDVMVPCNSDASCLHSVRTAGTIVIGCALDATALTIL